MMPGSITSVPSCLGLGLGLELGLGLGLGLGLELRLGLGSGLGLRPTPSPVCYRSSFANAAHLSALMERKAPLLASNLPYP